MRVKDQRTWLSNPYDAYSGCCTEDNSGFHHSFHIHNKADKRGTRIYDTPQRKYHLLCIQSHRYKPYKFLTQTDGRLEAGTAAMHKI